MVAKARMACVCSHRLLVYDNYLSTINPRLFTIKNFYARNQNRSFSNFFSETSGRSRRRRRRQQRLAEQQGVLVSRAGESQIVKDHETRSIRDILFPVPSYSENDEADKLRIPTSPFEWRDVLYESMALYRSTWQGFTTSKGILVDIPKDDIESKSGEFKETAESRAKEIKENARRNLRFARSETERLRDEVQERTGIKDKEDLRRWAGDMMKLATESVKQFMEGYRKGRDEEVEKMLTKYFRELEDEANKPKRRKRKRRILNHRQS